ncbi:MAG TPA: replicative DNA helicase [Gammaproteobacteria bacterium]|jgi:replicative DNA helicase|nr:replicative DNA helicase [Chromatiales bacterium]MDP7659990.1 replicative DNA helicase [Gammaproteobacteria bacterium]HJP38526.1 replicative DNA helicase [Gammaproteobacteria bacterium]
MVSAIPDQEQFVTETDRLNLPPNSVQAEQALLGGLMLDKSAWDRIADRVVESDFYRPDHQLIFSAIRTLSERNEPCDAVTLSEYFDSHKQLDKVGGLGYLGSLVQDTPSAANVADYARIVHDRGLLRALIQAGNEIAASAYHTEGRQITELVDEAERKVFEIAEQGQRRGSGFVQLRHVLSKTIDQIDERYQNQEAVTGLATGYNEFDQMTAGLQKGDLIIVAGRPSMGKTTLALNIAENAALNQSEQQPTAVFSMEMSTEQLALRMISSLGRVNQSSLRNGRLQDEDWPRINGAIQLMQEAPLFIDDTPALSPTDIRARARRLKRQHGLSLIVVDYLQLMQVAGSTENRATEISEISRSLKALARELEVPIIALSQLNRSVEQRTEKKPIMSDLRESGAIEQDADLIVFISREEIYDRETPRKGIADIHIAKQRNGPVGEFQLTFLGQYTKFENYVPEIKDF